MTDIQTDRQQTTGDILQTNDRQQMIDDRQMEGQTERKTNRQAESETR